ncbi:AAA family ATPase [Metaclostridioides mangenotii]|uniref:Replication-associated recombination protein RarA n=1 Tax=Metaclostridioides mangenotii TaxID=1540 RepID=A0ABS4E8R9_9FIRM|nr:AAA family ATPase [Clostridioides mangenotii]MBP1854330.1 replication-associated recombination protein RarA [Clostridioides mangenotii]
MEFKNNSIKEKLTTVEKELTDRLIGQDKFISDLCSFFYEKFKNNECGMLFLIGDEETGKKTSVRTIFESIDYSKPQNSNSSNNTKIVELDLSSYSFNFGYYAFLTDLYEALNSDTECILFKHADKADADTIRILSKIHPNSHIELDDEYVVKNKFMVKASDGDKNSIKSMDCKDKFLVFTANDLFFDLEKTMGSEFIKKVDALLYTKQLNKEEKSELLEREVINAIKTIESQFKVDIVAQRGDTDEYTKLYKFIQKNYRRDSNFGVSEYVSYIFTKPITNLMYRKSDEGIKTAAIYVENEDIFCKFHGESYNLRDYSTPTLEEAKYKLNSIIGIKDLKNFIDNIKTNYKVQKIRERLGLQTSNISLNMIFAGNAGTGKTNVARITFEYLNALGVLSKGVFKEVSKADFITENTADVAKRTNDIITSAIGGVLFVDEAYSLCESDEDKVGKEIVDALLKGIEDNRDDLVVILAGYEEDMEKFLSFNQGLKSRFPNWIHFEDYNPREMYEIAVNIADSKGYRIANDVKIGLIDLFERNQFAGKNDLGNARFVRNVVENAIMDASKKYLTNREKEIDLLEKDNFNFKVNTKFDLENKLKELIGLPQVKDLLRSQYKLIIAQEKRRAAGINTKVEQNLNMVFVGNSGTGKTSVARIVAEMLNSMGVLKLGQLIETNRSSFVAETLVDTPKKTEDKFKEAIGGILYIDEAYTLCSDHIGKLAFENLLNLINTYSDDVIVILSGHEDKMKEFFESNSGLQSKFPLWTVFEDYEPNELFDMATRLIESKGFRISNSGFKALKNSFIFVSDSIEEQSRNGRLVKNYVEDIIRNQSIRVAEKESNIYDMNLIISTDIDKSNIINTDSEFNLEDNLNRLTFNEDIKKFFREQYKFIKIQNKRKKYGLYRDSRNYQNMILVGEQGTGKKPAIKLISKMYYSLGFIDYKKPVILDSAEIISAYENKESVYDLLNKHLGKILIIDRVNKFFEDNRHKEILQYVYKFVEENSKKIIVAFIDESEKYDKNLTEYKSQNYIFPILLKFGNRGPHELYNLTHNLINESGLMLEKDIECFLEKTIEDLYFSDLIGLKNSRIAEAFVDVLIRVQSSRIFDNKIGFEGINLINKDDVVGSKERIIDQYKK